MEKIWVDEYWMVDGGKTTGNAKESKNWVVLFRNCNNNTVFWKASRKTVLLLKKKNEI